VSDIVTGPDGPKSQTRIQSVSRAVALLLAVAESPHGITARLLAEQLELSLPTTHHLLTTLWAEGMLLKNAERNFQLGPNAGIIADAYQRLDSVPESYRRALRGLMRDTGETAYLGVLRNGGVQVLATEEGAHAVRVVGLDVGYTNDMHARASAKVLLAFSPDEVRRSAVDQMTMKRLTPHTVTSRAAFLKQLDEVRTTGLAFDREEFQAGVQCASVPIWRGGRVVACFTVSSPSQRFSETEQDVIAALTRAADSLRDA
jgi:IclR family transcriptional regulator, acetate operon repressor